MRFMLTRLRGQPDGFLTEFDASIGPVASGHHDGGRCSLISESRVRVSRSAARMSLSIAWSTTTSYAWLAACADIARAVIKEHQL